MFRKFCPECEWCELVFTGNKKIVANNVLEEFYCENCGVYIITKNGAFLREGFL